MKNDPRSCDRNFYNCVKKPEKKKNNKKKKKKKSGLQQGPLKSWIFFRLLYAIVKIAITTARIILHLIIDYTCQNILDIFADNFYCYRECIKTIMHAPVNHLELRLYHHRHHRRHPDSAVMQRLASLGTDDEKGKSLAPWNTNISKP